MSSDAITKTPKRQIGIPIKPGQVLNPKGRPKGSRHKLGEMFIEAMHADFKKHGKQVIDVVRETKPDQYLKVIASLLPKQLQVDLTPMQEMSDEELAGILNAVRSLVAAHPAEDAGTRAAGETAH